MSTPVRRPRRAGKTSVNSLNELLWLPLPADIIRQLVFILK